MGTGRIKIYNFINIALHPPKAFNRNILQKLWRQRDANDKNSLDDPLGCLKVKDKSQ